MKNEKLKSFLKYFLVFGLGVLTVFVILYLKKEYKQYKELNSETKAAETEVAADVEEVVADANS